MENSKIIKKAAELIAIPSTVDNKPALKQAVDLLADYISTNKNITIERFKSGDSPSFLAYAGKIRPEKFDVLLNAHVDVVPAPAKDFEPYIKNDKLYGRGAYDMKVAAVVLADIFLELAGKTPTRLGLQIVSDEEVGGFNGTYHQLKQGIPKADFVIAGEMTNLEICNETRGICWVDVHFKGVKAHGGYIWDGKNAIMAASEFASQVIQKLPIPNKKTWTCTANIASIETDNVTYNQVPENAVVKIDFRFTPRNKNFSSEQAVKNFLLKLYPKITKIEVKMLAPAVEVSADNVVLQQLTQAFAAATGQEAKLIKRYASGDARHFSERGQNCIEFGLSGDNMHADNEYAELSSIEPYHAALTKFLTDFKM